MATPIKWGKEFVIGTTTEPYPNAAPTITGLADGRFVLAWSEWRKAVADDIRAQIFNADASKSGDEFRVNKTTDKNQTSPAIAALAGEGFVVAWYDNSKTGGDKSFTAVRAQVFKDDGSKSGGEFLVNTTTEKYQSDPAITGLVNGRFVITWSHNVANEDIQDVRAQVFEAGGSKFGGEILVNTTTDFIQQGPATAGLVDGGFVVAWTDLGTSGSSVRAQIFSADGGKSGGEFLVNTTTENEQVDPAIAGLGDGRFIVAWTAWSEGSGSDVRAQIINADGSKFGGELPVNTTTLDNQFDPTVAGLADGRFVVAWIDDPTPGPPTVRGQLFNADGSKSGGEFVVKAGAKYLPSATITGLADGRFVIAWAGEGKNGDKSGTAVRGQVFDPREEAIDLTGSSRDDQFVGTRYDDAIDGVKGNDWLLGAKGKDLLEGGKGKDLLEGGNGKDLIEGGHGKDKLDGGGGPDRFAFREMGKNNADKLVDFKPGVDRIGLDGDVFTGIGDTLLKKQFEIGRKADDGEDRIIYDMDKGKLFWDGDGKGGADQELFAKVAPGLKLGADDFLMA